MWRQLLLIVSSKEVKKGQTKKYYDKRNNECMEGYGRNCVRINTMMWRVAYGRLPKTKML